jgi:hypothetical protein
MELDPLIDELTARLCWNQTMAKSARYCVTEAARWIWYRIRRNQEIIASLELQIQRGTNVQRPGTHAEAA